MSLNVEIDAGCRSENDLCFDRASRYAPTIPISMAKVGEKGTIVRISGKEDVRKSLIRLGFIAGTKVSAVSTAGGSVILEIKGSRIAIDCQMASKIMFCPES